jgi:hypothetical protein
VADRRRSSLKNPEPPTLCARPHGNVTIPEASISAEITYEDRRKGKLEATVRIVDLPPYSQATKAAAA